jgi:tRNA threonylcarbamoyladenosine biosynthesis protein TsaE
MEIITQSASETKKLGEQTALDLLRRIRNKQSLDSQSQESRIKAGKVIALSGDLGSGKTTFIQGFAEGLGITNRLVSPTFILMRQYPIQSGKLYHLDVYRLEKNAEEEARDLGLMEILSDPDNIVVIEWAEKIKNILPPNTQWIDFQYIDENARKISSFQFPVKS